MTRSDLRPQPELIILVVLLLVGVGVVVGYTGRDGPPRFVMWLLLGWLIALVAAMAAYSRAVAKTKDGRGGTER